MGTYYGNEENFQVLAELVAECNSLKNIPVSRTSNGEFIIIQVSYAYDGFFGYSQGSVNISKVNDNLQEELICSCPTDRRTPDQ